MVAAGIRGCGESLPAEGRRLVALGGGCGGHAMSLRPPRPPREARRAEGFDTIKLFATKSIKNVNFRDNIRNFAGLRAEADTGDFILGEAEDVKGFFNMAGTKSPGLTSAPAMAVDLEIGRAYV